MTLPFLCPSFLTLNYMLFYSGFRNARQTFGGCGGTIRDMSHTPDISSWRVLCMWSSFFKIYFWILSTVYMTMTHVSVSSFSFPPAIHILIFLSCAVRYFRAIINKKEQLFTFSSSSVVRFVILEPLPIRKDSLSLLW